MKFLNTFKSKKYLLVFLFIFAATISIVVANDGDTSARNPMFGTVKGQVVKAYQDGTICEEYSYYVFWIRVNTWTECKPCC